MPNNYILTSSGSFVSEDELYHYGVKGMKWGVRKVLEVANNTYRGIIKNGADALEREAQRNDYRSNYHASKGHKIRAKYYDWKSYKTRQTKFDDAKSFCAGLDDISVKVAATATAVSAGYKFVKKLIHR